MDAVLRAAGLGLKGSFRHWAFLRNMAAASVRDAYGRERTARLEPIFAPDELSRKLPHRQPRAWRRRCAALLRGRHPWRAGSMSKASLRDAPLACLHRACVRAIGCSLPVRMPWTSRSKRCLSVTCVPRPNNACGSCSSSWKQQAERWMTWSRRPFRPGRTGSLGLSGRVWRTVQAAPAESVDACRPHHDGRRVAPGLPGGDRRRRMARPALSVPRVRSSPSFQALSATARGGAAAGRCSWPERRPAIPCVAPQPSPVSGAKRRRARVPSWNRR